MSDPINDPQPGDRILTINGDMLRVTARYEWPNGGKVDWVRETHNGDVEPNSWSLLGWSKTVCQGATVIDAPDGGAGLFDADAGGCAS